MASSKVEICNLALDLLQVDDPVTDIDNPSTKTEETCSRWYDSTRQQALRAHSWNFAIKRESLAKDVTAPAFGYSAAFNLPADYIRLMYATMNDVNVEQMIDPQSYAVEGNQILIGGIRSVTPDTLNIVYTSDFTNVPKFDPLFTAYLYTLLAQNMAYSLTQSNTNIQRINGLMDQVESKAKAMDGQESPPRRRESSKALSARSRVGSHRNRDGYIIFS